MNGYCPRRTLRRIIEGAAFGWREHCDQRRHGRMAGTTRAASVRELDA
jgi:hypothetical protein